MSKRKSVELFEETHFPKALIVGGGSSANYLSQIISQKSCSAETIGLLGEEVVLPTVLPGGGFDYIFQFGHFDLTDTLLRYLRPGGRLLVVETYEEKAEKIASSGKVRIIKIGDLNSWNPTFLAEKLLKTMFARNIESIVDTAKGSPSPRKKEESKPQKPIKLLSPTPIIKVKKSYFKKRLLFLLTFFLIIAISVFGSVYWYGQTVKKTFAKIPVHIAASDFPSLVSDLREAKRELQIAEDVYQVAYRWLLPLRHTSFMRDSGTLLSVNRDLLQTGEEIVFFFQRFKLTSSNVFSSENFPVSETDIDLSLKKINNLSYTISLAKKQLETINPPFFPKESYAGFLDSSYNKLNNITQLLPVFQKLFLGKTSRTYLVLFQNNMELRATGGFIGSFALVTISKGKITDFRILDVYTADGQLKGHVEPPIPIRKYMGQPNFFMRDSNFDPDFAVSALRASWFLEKELGVKVDGVVGVNLFVAQKLLKIIGPVVLSDFNNEEVNSENFFFKSQYYVQKDFFAGSTQKKDFLTAVVRKLETKLTTDNNLPWFELVLGLKNLLDEKNVIIYTYDEDAQKVVEERGWAGRMTPVACFSQKLGDQTGFPVKTSCIADYLSIIETNLGVNKANYFISKTVALEKKIETDGKVKTTITLSYENKGLEGILHGGTYSNYIRLFVPTGNKLITATYNNSPIDALVTEVGNYGDDKTVFAFFVKIPSNEKGVVRVMYVTEKPLDWGNKYFQFIYQKQGGDKTVPFVYSVYYPENIKLSTVNFKSRSSNKGEIYYPTDTSVDRIFALEREE